MWVSTGDLLFCINVKLNLWRFVRPMTVSVLSFGSTSVSSMLAGVEFLLAMQPMSICCSLSHHLQLLYLMIFQSGTVLTGIFTTSLSHSTRIVIQGKYGYSQLLTRYCRVVVDSERLMTTMMARAHLLSTTLSQQSAARLLLSIRGQLSAHHWPYSR